MSKLTKVLLGVGGSLALILLVVVLVGNNQPKPASPANEDLPVGRETSFQQVKSGDLVNATKRLTLGSGDQLECWQNKSGALAFVDPAQTWGFVSGGVASTSFTLDIATSSDGTTIGGKIAQDGGGYYATGTLGAGTADGVVGFLPYSPILDSFIIATNTDFAIGSTSLAIAQLLRSAQNGTDTETEGGPVPVQNTEYVCALLTATFEDPQIKPCNSTSETFVAENSCEQATSTNRGFNLDVFLGIKATSTPRDL